MEQVERLCNNICLINKGSLLFEGALDNIREKHTSNAVEVRFSGDIDKSAISSYFSEFNISENNISGVLKKNPRDFLTHVNNIVDVLSFQIKVPSLEQIFLEEISDKK